MTKNFILISIILLAWFQNSAQTVPVKNGSRYSFTYKGIYFEVDPQAGGRISSFKHRGKELLYTDTTKKNNNWGSTFWPAPQAVWGWPPHDTLDSSPYTPAVSGSTLKIKSMDQKHDLHCRFEKSFRINEADECVSVTYTIVNTGKTADTLGPWQITRVPSGGLTFFPSGTTEPRGQLLPLLKQSDNISWFDYDSAFISKDPDAVPKLFSDGSEGWLAHITAKDRRILIFKFDDTPAAKRAPGEDEIEIYANPALNYSELEPLGPYKIIPAGQSHSWTVLWYARQIPVNVKLQAGNPELVKMVRSIIGTTKTVKQ